MEKIILSTNFTDLKFFKRGKVREVYELGENFLIVSTDRISAFDVIMDQGIPSKGKVLNTISNFWFNFTSDIISNHIIATDVSEYPETCLAYQKELAHRSMLVKKTKPFPIECIVRGYISGSGWADYQNSGEICGIKLPDGLVESDKLPEIIFTPSTKAEIGVHDENIDEKTVINLIGKDDFEFIKNKSIEVYKKCSDFASSKGIIIADTKMEFGIDENDNIILIDELLTPDSSRFWAVNKYQAGRAQDSFDKQYLRDYLISINFNRQPPPPHLPDTIIQNTSRKYLEALHLLTGLKIENETN